MGLIPLGILSSAGSQLSGSYELITTTVLTSTVASLTLSNLGDYAGIYKHLQIRAVVRDNRAVTAQILAGRLNGDTGTNYTGHGLAANGSTVTSFRTAENTHFHAGLSVSASATSGEYSATIIDILDAYSTTKYKVTRSMTGAVGPALLRVYSGLWLNTASTTSFTIFGASGSLVAGTRMSIYGIR
jgi:hypothetical protein